MAACGYMQCFCRTTDGFHDLVWKVRQTAIVVLSSVGMIGMVWYGMVWWVLLALYATYVVVGVSADMWKAWGVAPRQTFVRGV